MADSRTRVTDPRPNPRPFRLVTVEESASVRRLDCAEYGACLEHAAVNNWCGFSCSSCRAYVALSPSAKQRDLVPLCALARHVVDGLEPANDNRAA